MIISSGYAVSHYASKSPSQYVQEDSSLSEIIDESAVPVANAKDSDGDGLFDWEELLWGTDPNNPDTDGDGVSDKDNPNRITEPSPKEVADSSEKEMTRTEQLSLDLFQTYLELKKQSETGTGDPKSLASLIAENKVSVNVETITPSDLTAVPETPENIERYAKALTDILIARFPQAEQSDQDLLLTAIQTQNPELAKTIGKHAESYTLASEEMRRLSVPEKALNLHTDVVNSLSWLAETTRLASLVFTDPVSALYSLQAYQNAGILFSQNLNSLSLYLQAQNL